MRGPGKSTLDNPAKGSNKPCFRFDTFSYIAFSSRFDNMVDKGSSVAHVARNTLDSWVGCYRLIVYSTAADSIMDIGGMNDYSK